MADLAEIEKRAEKKIQFGPEKSGELFKQGGFRKNWLKRTFVLKNNELYYLKSSGDSKKQGIVPIDGNWSAEDYNIPGKKYGFIVKNPYGGRSYFCLANNETDRKEWVDAIRKTIACIGGEGMFDDLEEGGAGASSKVETQISIPTGKDKVGLEDFELISMVGKGSFGKVMLVKKKDTQKVYAMKVLRKEAIIAGNQVQHTRAERSILQEVACPFIVKLHYAFQTQGKLYLILDFVRGGELFFQLKREGSFPEERVRLYAAEIILALQHLHDKNIVYRDLKPENILLDDVGHIVLTDFGLSKEAVTKNNGARTFCGTPEYLAPEILKGVGHGKAVDWWSLGTLIYEMLTGLPPFYSENRKVMFEKILRGELLFPSEVSSNAQDLLRGLLTRDPEKRLGSDQSDSSQIKSHPFFASLNWDKISKKEYVPKYKPAIKDITDTSNFDPEYTTMEMSESPVAANELENGQNDFVGFTYVGKSNLGREE